MGYIYTSEVYLPIATHHYTMDGKYMCLYGKNRYIGDQFLEDLLKGNDGSVITLSEAKMIHPHYTLILSAINSKVRDVVKKRENEKKSNRYNGIYICYRWESEELRQEVREITNFLRKRGYRVELDQDEILTEDFLAPARFMAKMAECSTVLMVLTKNFGDARDASGQDRIGWVLDEQMVALKLQKRGLLKIVWLVLADGYRWPAIEPDETIDVSHLKDSWKKIGEHFPKQKRMNGLLHTFLRILKS